MRTRQVPAVCDCDVVATNELEELEPSVLTFIHKEIRGW